jgi:hypothetical protein
VIDKTTSFPLSEVKAIRVICQKQRETGAEKKKETKKCGFVFDIPIEDLALTPHGSTPRILSCPACGQHFVYTSPKLGGGVIEESPFPAFAMLFNALLTLENARIEFVVPAKALEIILSVKQ